MKYDNPKLHQILAAEYVLGTLRGRARHRFERLARSETAVRSEIRFWESRLAGLAADLEPKSPPPSVWFALQHRIDSARAVVTPIRRPLPPPVQTKDVPPPTSPWRILAGLATAAGVVLAVLIGTRVPLPGEPASGPVAITTPPPAVSPVPAPVPAPIYVSLLRLPESDMQWTLAVRPAADEVLAVASGAYPRLGAHSLELWLITEAGPVSLGLLPTAGEGRLKLPAGVSGAQLTLAISMEPVGGSPTGQPTGPVLTSGPALKAA
ncbi:MAG: anti-sigma factor [Nevskia sp.]|uniref:anti-sigma factor n=1 Tax=Nevskia sp. TaxID=1929292 RepID=UPI0040367F20